MYNIEVLIATMFKETKNDIIDLLDNMNLNSDCVIVSQCSKNKIEKYEYKDYTITCIYSSERGLSRSRNLALRYATADIVLVADDDIQFESNYTEIIIKAFITYPDDILTFQVHPEKRYPSKEKGIGSFYVHRVASYEIAMKRCSIRNIQFNTLFGTGSGVFSHGEENIFLNNCFKQKKYMRYVPVKIAGFMPQTRASTWFSGYNKKFFIDQGALYYELSHQFALIFILLFSIRKYLLYRKSMGFLKSIYYMIYGIIEYKNILTK